MPPFSDGNPSPRPAAPLSIPFVAAIAGTAFVFLLAVALIRFIRELPLKHDDFETLNFIGAFITGFGTVGTLIWLCATFAQQKHDLKLQQEQLESQRRSLESISRATKIPAAVQLSLGFTEHLSRTVRSMLLLTGTLTEKHIQDLDALTLRGYRIVYFQELLDDDAHAKAIDELINRNDNIALHYVTNFMRESDRFRHTLYSYLEMGDISYALYDLSLVSEVRNIFVSIMNRDGRC